MKRNSSPINSSGFRILNKLKKYLADNPNQSAKEISANFNDINFHTIRYHLARAVKYQHLLVTAGKVPSYMLNPIKYKP